MQKPKQSPNKNEQRPGSLAAAKAAVRAALSLRLIAILPNLRLGPIVEVGLHRFALQSSHTRRTLKRGA